MTLENDRLQQADLRDLLNEWDPIGVADEVDVEDEYDCLLAPLWSRLTRGTTRALLSDYLCSELRDHFGLDPVYYDTDLVADRLLDRAAGWESAG